MADEPLHNDPISLLWRMLPPEARKSYGSIPAFIAEMSPGAAIRDTLDESGKLTRSLLEGRGWDAAGAGAGLLTAMAGVVPGTRTAAKVSKEVAPAIVKATEPIRAYHGSPHDFDRFDLSKIGTGEGAQAYGHGLYFADKEGTARAYRDQLSGGLYETSQGVKPHHEIWSGASEAAQKASPMPLSSSDRIASNILDGVKEAGSIEKYLKQYDLPGGQYGDAYRAAADHIAALQAKTYPGHMYEVNIHADPARFLDWDKPFSQQSPEVQAALRDVHAKNQAYYDKYKDRPGPQIVKPDDYSGARIYESSKLVPGDYRDPAAASAALKEAGIPGIRYLDQGSRTAGEGSRNTVVFDPKIIEIMRKYGLLPVAAGGAAAATVPGLLDQQPAEAY